ncbi:MAG TPA: GNAT family protein [Longilinea sp.]|nr:GNAT family protein [Longilinea sp.]
MMATNSIDNGFLVGDLVYLRPLMKSDAEQIRKWANDPELRGLTGETLPMTLEEAEAYIERIRGDQSRVWFMVVAKDTGKVIGETGLLRMFYAWRNTDLSIIIGEQEGRGKGYGLEAINLMLDYAFGYLNFHRVSIGVVGFNEKALKFYEKVGFKREGIQRDGYFYNHEYSDFVMMSILEDEYREQKTGKKQ